MKIHKYQLIKSGARRSNQIIEIISATDNDAFLRGKRWIRKRLRWAAPALYEKQYLVRPLRVGDLRLYRVPLRVNALTDLVEIKK